MGEDRIVSAGMFDDGAHEEDSPVTWEILIIPRRKKNRWYGEPVTNLQRERGSGCLRDPDKNKHPPKR
jgi:hypothetical protein